MRMKCSLASCDAVEVIGGRQSRRVEAGEDCVTLAHRPCHRTTGRTLRRIGDGLFQSCGLDVVGSGEKEDLVALTLMPSALGQKCVDGGGDPQVSSAAESAADRFPGGEMTESSRRAISARWGWIDRSA